MTLTTTIPEINAHIDRGLGGSSKFYHLLYKRLLLDFEVGDFIDGEDSLKQLLELAALAQWDPQPHCMDLRHWGHLCLPVLRG